MKVIVFGATGLCGKYIVKECQKKGNEVSIYTRGNSFALQGVHVVTGNIDDEPKISAAIANNDVVVCAVGNRNYADPTKVVTPFIKLACKHINEQQRFIVVAGSGLTLFDFKTLRRDLPGQPPFLVNQRADHWEAYCHLAPLDINYLVICPGMMVEGDADENYLFEKKYFPKSENKQVYAGNVAHFIAGEISNAIYKQTRIGIINK